ncbi:sterile alpha motif domain-containing protein 9-like [Liolophura sinensis]|uniref:sterile alpha motif domain-containing protein 9-like n=1 Tax=Liolophura sinensis TaxID=3198878 RepID=UPI003158EE51
MSSDDLSQYLRVWADKQGIDQEFISVVQNENIDGEVLFEMTQDEINDLFPAMSFGYKKKLFLLSKHEGRSRLSSDSPEREEFEEEFLAEFNKATKPTTSYRRYGLIRDKCKSVTNLIDRVSRFVPAQDKTGEDLLSQISMETVRFAAACINSRTNGTIHFGISDEGEIQGIAVDKDRTTSEVKKMLRARIFSDQRTMVDRCVRPPRFVEVIQAENDLPLCVVEVDVVPLHSIVGDEAVFLSISNGPRLTKNKSTKLYIFKGDTVSELTGDGIRKYMSEKCRFSEQRRQEEDTFVNKQKKSRVPNLRDKFIELFCDGTETLDDGIYPLLLCGKPDEKSRRHITAENFHFLKMIEWQMIMDLDDKASKDSLYGVYEEQQGKTTRTLTSDEFDPRLSKESGDRLEEITNSSLPPWMFLNGYALQDQKALSPLDWKAERFTNFKEVLRHFYTAIPKDRAVVMILLLSKDYGVMVDILADEIYTKFQDQWIVIAEDGAIADPLKKELLRRNVHKSTVENRFLVGIPWKHVSELVKQLKGPADEHRCLLPTSTGAPCHLKEKVKNSLTDIDILSLNQCQESEFQDTPEKLQEKQRTEEEQFYKGNEVSWWNFWFKNHVCQRKELSKLTHQVKVSLQGDIRGGDKVGRVHLYHQPGAGCTTLSKHVLWDCRSTYRCCIVKRISEQTCAQIAKLYAFEEDENPQPVLVLIDNFPEEERVDQLHAELEETGRQMAKWGQNCNIFCVMLISYRRGKQTSDHQSQRIWLTHNLHEEELLWFKEKHATLEKHHMENKGVDPNTLIAFNILRENFNPEYISRTVQEFLGGITDIREQTLLKFVSLINSFDVDFKPIPIPCFDPLMVPDSTQRKLLQKKRWESELSSSMKILLVKRPTQGLRGTLQGLRVSNFLLSCEILKKMLLSRQESVVDATLQLLHAPIWKGNDVSLKELKFVIKNLVKKRAWIHGGKSTKFSPLIEKIREEESFDDAASIMDTVYEKTNDAMVAQQIARLYIEAENWEKASKYAKDCTRLKSQNSCIWDTYGQVFKRKLKARYEKTRKEYTDVSHQCTKEEREAIRDGFKAIDIFRREQTISRTERTMVVLNTAGYFGEVQVTTIILDLLRLLSPFDDKDVLHRFLVESDFYPPKVIDSFGEEICKRLKCLGKDSSEALTFLEEDFLHLKDGSVNDDRKNVHRNNKQKLIALTEHHLSYFGEEEDSLTANLSSEEAAEFRRRRVKRLVGWSLGKILDASFQENGTRSQQQAQELLHQNISSNQQTVFDYKCLIGITLTQSINNENVRYTLTDLMKYSQEMFGMIKESDRVELEAYLYFVMFNWPMEDGQNVNRCHLGKLRTAILQWKEAFYKQYPAQREGRPFRRKETTIFHLGNGVELQQYTHYRQLQGNHKIRGEKFWTNPETVSKLRILEGTLLHDGAEVQFPVCSAEGNVSRITIPSGMLIHDKSLWNKRVFFCVGFSWCGPKANGISAEDPTMMVSRKSMPSKDFLPLQPQRTGVNSRRFDLNSRQLYQQLQRIDDLKSKKRSGIWLPPNEWMLVTRERELRNRLDAIMDQALDDTQLPYN